jgi:CpeT protein
MKIKASLAISIIFCLSSVNVIWAIPTETPIAPDTQNNTNNADVQNIVTYLLGIMDTNEQAATNRKVANVQMTTCKVTVKTTPTDSLDQNNRISVFLYQEQALIESLNQPYRQRFLEITNSNEPNLVESKSYKPTELEQWIGFCQKPEVERLVSQVDLGMPICSVFLKQSAANYIQPLYIGETQKGGCPANVRGATSITNTIYLFPDGMNTWDRGFDASGNQVWGAANEAYKFRKKAR